MKMKEKMFWEEQQKSYSRWFILHKNNSNKKSRQCESTYIKCSKLQIQNLFRPVLFNYCFYQYLTNCWQAIKIAQILESQQKATPTLKITSTLPFWSVPEIPLRRGPLSPAAFAPLCGGYSVFIYVFSGEDERSSARSSRWGSCMGNLLP